MVQVFPNPTTSAFTITGDLDSYTIELLDNLGRIQQRIQPATATYTFDLSGLPNGLYMLHVFDNAGYKVEVQKIVKQ